MGKNLIFLVGMTYQKLFGVLTLLVLGMTEVMGKGVERIIIQKVPDSTSLTIYLLI